MRLPPTPIAAALAATLLAALGHANEYRPGSVLVYPVQRSGLDLGGCPSSCFWTIVSVTNINTMPATPSSLGGSTNVKFEYLNTIRDPARPLQPQHCFVNDVVEFLTPADTFSVLTSCHNASHEAGYLVVHAQDPSLFDTAWSWDYLIGSEMLLTATGGMFYLNAIPFSSPLPDRAPTDLDGDRQLDFNGAEYQGAPDLLYVDSFIAPLNASLALINLTGGVDFVATAKFDVWNDNEFPFSTTVTFRCWFNEPLVLISPIFTQGYLLANTPNDLSELDVNCDGRGELESGWLRINGLVATSTAETIPDPAFLGALTAGPDNVFDAGSMLWESEQKQLNGDFVKFGVDDREYP